MKADFQFYFPKETMQDIWLLDPFKITPETLPEYLDDEEEMELLRLIFDPVEKRKFGKVGDVKFWMSLKNDYPRLHDLAMKAFLPFVTSYLCERGFSEMVYLKNKRRSSLNLEEAIFIKISKIKPVFAVKRRSYSHLHEITKYK